MTEIRRQKIQEPEGKSSQPVAPATDERVLEILRKASEQEVRKYYERLISLNPKLEALIGKSGEYLNISFEKDGKLKVIPKDELLASAHTPEERRELQQKIITELVKAARIYEEKRADETKQRAVKELDKQAAEIDRKPSRTFADHLEQQKLLLEKGTIKNDPALIFSALQGLRHLRETDNPSVPVAVRRQLYSTLGKAELDWAVRKARDLLNGNSEMDAAGSFDSQSEFQKREQYRQQLHSAVGKLTAADFLDPVTGRLKDQTALELAVRKVGTDPGFEQWQNALERDFRTAATSGWRNHIGKAGMETGFIHITPEVRGDGKNRAADYYVDHPAVEGTVRTLSPTETASRLQNFTQVLPGLYLRQEALKRGKEADGTYRSSALTLFAKSLSDQSTWECTDSVKQEFNRERERREDEYKKSREPLAKDFTRAANEETKKHIAGKIARLDGEFVAAQAQYFLDFTSDRVARGALKLSAGSTEALSQLRGMFTDDERDKTFNAVCDTMSKQAIMLALSAGAANIIRAGISGLMRGYLGAAGVSTTSIGYSAAIFTTEVVVEGIALESALKVLQRVSGDKHAFDNYVTDCFWSVIQFGGLKVGAQLVAKGFGRMLLNSPQAKELLGKLTHDMPLATNYERQAAAVAQLLAKPESVQLSQLFGRELRKGELLEIASILESVSTATVKGKAVIRNAYAGANIAAEISGFTAAALLRHRAENGEWPSSDKGGEILWESAWTVVALKAGGRATKRASEAFHESGSELGARAAQKGRQLGEGKADITTLGKISFPSQPTEKSPPSKPIGIAASGQPPPNEPPFERADPPYRQATTEPASQKMEPAELIRRAQELSPSELSAQIRALLNTAQDHAAEGRLLQTVDQVAAQLVRDLSSTEQIATRLGQIRAVLEELTPAQLQRLSLQTRTDLVDILSRPFAGLERNPRDIALAVGIDRTNTIPPEFRRGPDESLRVSISERLAADPFLREVEGREGLVTQEERYQFGRRVIEITAEAYGLPMPRVIRQPQGGWGSVAGLAQGQRYEVTLSVDGKDGPASELASVMNTAIHETRHLFQFALIARYLNLNAGHTAGLTDTSLPLEGNATENLGRTFLSSQMIYPSGDESWLDPNYRRNFAERDARDTAEDVLRRVERIRQSKVGSNRRVPIEKPITDWAALAALFEKAAASDTQANPPAKPPASKTPDEAPRDPLTAVFQPAPQAPSQPSAAREGGQTIYRIGDRTFTFHDRDELPQYNTLQRDGGIMLGEMPKWIPMDRIQEYRNDVQGRVGAQPNHYLVTRSPLGLVELAIELGAENPQLRTIREDLRAGRFTPEGLALVDAIIACRYIDPATGNISERRQADPEQLVILALLGNQSAAQDVNRRVQMLYANDARVKQDIIDRHKLPSSYEPVRPEELVVVRAQNEEPVEMPDGSVHVLPAASGTDGSYVRDSVHTTLNHKVGSHADAGWEDAPYTIISPYKATVQQNGDPSVLYHVDTYWRRNPGQPLIFPKAIVVKPGVPPENGLFEEQGHRFIYKHDGFTAGDLERLRDTKIERDLNWALKGVLTSKLNDYVQLRQGARHWELGRYPNIPDPYPDGFDFVKFFQRYEGLNPRDAMRHFVTEELNGTANLRDPANREWVEELTVQLGDVLNSFLRAQTQRVAIDRAIKRYGLPTMGSESEPFQDRVQAYAQQRGIPSLRHSGRPEAKALRPFPTALEDHAGLADDSRAIQQQNGWQFRNYEEFVPELTIETLRSIVALGL